MRRNNTVGAAHSLYGTPQPDPFETLAHAIILRAVKDYRRALRTLKKVPDNAVSWRTKDECERFFRSTWFNDLSGLNGKKIEEQLQKETA